MDIEPLLELIKLDEGDLTEAQKIILLDSGRQLSNAVDKITDENLGVLCNYILDEFQTSSGYKKAYLGSLLHFLTGNLEVLGAAIQGVFERAHNVESAMADLYGLISLQFKSDPRQLVELETVLNRSVLHTLYNATLTELKSRVDANNIQIKNDFTPNNRVVVITAQLLTPPHAPTNDLLAYSKLLKQEHEKDVMIVNTCELAQTYEGSIITRTKPNVMVEYSHNTTLQFEGVNFKLFQAADANFNEASQMACIQAIENFDPAMILVIGSCCLTAELFNDRAYVIMHPLALDVPLTINNHFEMPIAPTKKMQALIDHENLQDKFVFAQHPGFEPPEQIEHLKRSQYNIPEDKYTFVTVGNRLKEEVDDQYLQMLDNICQSGKAHMVFLGTYDMNNINDEYSSLRENMTYINYHVDIMAVYEIMDAFISPARFGGGSSAIFALHAGLPVLNLPMGDIAAASSCFPETPSYEDMQLVAIQLAEDKTLQEEYGHMAVEAAKTMKGRAALLDRIVQSYDDYAANKVISS